MKKTMFLAFCACIAMTMLTACDHSDEMVPLDGFDMSTST